MSLKTTTTRRATLPVVLGSVLAVICLGAGVPAAAQEQGEGPTSLIITYKCSPQTRMAFRQHMEGPGVAQLEKWKSEGVFADYLALFSSYVNESTWDAMLVLSFARYADTERWREIERRMPGGLSEEALALASPVTAYLADLTWEKAANGPMATDPVYFVIPYDYEDRGSYKRYVDAYVTPQLEGWIREGVVTSYQVYLNQHQTGDPWDSLFVLEYRDLAAFAKRDVLKSKVRGSLREDPAWTTISDNKQLFRSEGQTVIAEAIAPK